MTDSRNIRIPDDFDDSDGFSCHFCDEHCGESQRKFIQGIPEHICDDCWEKLHTIIREYDRTTIHAAPTVHCEGCCGQSVHQVTPNGRAFVGPCRGAIVKVTP